MRKWTCHPLTYVIVMMFWAVTAGQVDVNGSEGNTSPYSYYYKGKLISLDASTRFIAMQCCSPSSSKDRRC